MVTEQTKRQHAQRDRLLAEAQQLETAIAAAVQQDYPDLRAWKLEICAHRWVGNGWRAYRSAGEHARYLRRYLDQAVHVTASRISEVYGLGAGVDWMARHGLGSQYDPDTLAAAQARASLAAVARWY